MKKEIKRAKRGERTQFPLGKMEEELTQYKQQEQEERREARRKRRKQKVHEVECMKKLVSWQSGRPIQTADVRNEARHLQNSFTDFAEMRTDLFMFPQIVVERQLEKQKGKTTDGKNRCKDGRRRGEKYKHNAENGHIDSGGDASGGGTWAAQLQKRHQKEKQSTFKYCGGGVPVSLPNIHRKKKKKHF
jgi:hypothetical protein